MGISPAIFGSNVWRFMHLLSITYPVENADEETQAKTLAYLLSIVKVLPCPGCSQHAQKYIDDHPPTLSNRPDFVHWVNTFHNVVNARLGRRTFTDEESIEETKRFFFGGEDWENLPTYEQWRREDHAKIDKLKQKLITQTNDNNDHINVLRGLAVATLAVLFILFVSLFAISIWKWSTTKAKTNNTSPDQVELL